MFSRSSSSDPLLLIPVTIPRGNDHRSGTDVVALGIQSVTFFTQERVVDAGPLKVDVQKPHTIVFHPVAAAAAIGAGLLLVIVGTRAKTG